MNNIIALNALRDNYIWIIHDESDAIIVVDPGEADPVFSYLQKHNLVLKGILLTHHHFDHSGGIAALLSQYPDIPVYSSTTDSVPGVTQTVKEGDGIQFENLKDPIHVLEIPGHTLGHVAYLYQNGLFSGDTLFSVGSGKIFEGTPSQMYHSLNKLKALSLDTLIYCGHEYTLANIAFAQMIDPNNQRLVERKQQVQILRNQNLPSLPVSLESELQTNPFLRCEQPVIINAVQAYSQKILSNPIEILAELRKWKNNIA